MKPDITQLLPWIKQQKVAFIASIDEDGYPNLKAMLPPRKIEDAKVFYFTTNTSSMRVAQYRTNSSASIYFYHKGLVSYQGLLLRGTMEVCEDTRTKQEIWRHGDTLYYRQGVTDPDYCVLKFTANDGRYYHDLHTESFMLPDNV